jgi:hypothetical protein
MAAQAVGMSESVMANHPEFTLEEAEKMLQEAGF